MDHFWWPTPPPIAKILDPSWSFPLKITLRRHFDKINQESICMALGRFSSLYSYWGSKATGLQPLRKNYRRLMTPKLGNLQEKPRKSWRPPQSSTRKAGIDLNKNLPGPLDNVKGIHWLIQGRGLSEKISFFLIFLILNLSWTFLQWVHAVFSRKWAFELWRPGA